jgi:hypothetical protein
VAALVLALVAIDVAARPFVPLPRKLLGSLVLADRLADFIVSERLLPESP